MDYLHDVFVSYAHVDDESLLGDKDKGWVRTLVDKLKKKTDMEVRGQPVEIWMDPRLAGNRPFEDEILAGLDHSAILLIFMSKRYANSYWCQREQNTFLEKVKQWSNAKTRVFVVEKNKLEGDQTFPDEFLGLPRYQFWSEDNISKRVKTFGDPVPKEDEDEYWSELGRLAEDLGKELNQLRKQPDQSEENSALAVHPAPKPSPPPAETPQSSQKDGPAVFLAEVTDDLRQKYREVRSYLEQYSIEVLPEAPYDRHDRVAYKDSMASDLKSCVLFVQLLSGLTGETAEAFPGYPVYQHEIARSLNLPIFQWRLKELKVEEADSVAQTQLLNLPSVRAEPIDDFKKAVLEAARPIEIPPPPPRIGASVFVNTDTCDRSLADKICQWLADHGIPAFLPLQRGDPKLTAERITQDFEQNLKLCDGLMVVYGDSDAPWVRGQFLLGSKILSQRSPPVIAVYVAPPLEKPDHGVRYPHMLPLDCGGNPQQPDEAALSRFLSKLRGDRP